MLSFLFTMAFCRSVYDCIRRFGIDFGEVDIIISNVRSHSLNPELEQLISKCFQTLLHINFWGQRKKNSKIWPVRNEYTRNFWWAQKISNGTASIYLLVDIWYFYLDILRSTPFNFSSCLQWYWKADQSHKLLISCMVQAVAPAQ